MKIRKLEATTQLYEGFSDIETALLKYNNIEEADIKQLLPDICRSDIFGYKSDFKNKSYIEYMKPIDKGDEFVNYIKNHMTDKYCIVGDYDCDGIMATSILCHTLSCIGCDVTYTIPDRFVDGYGMNNRQVDVAIQNGCNTIITVDNGIVANDAIDYAHKKGLYVIVTDHHTPQGKCNGDIVIDPLYNNDKFKSISGATVAFKLAYLLLKEFENSNDELTHEKLHNKYRYLEFMAFITVYSDVMPMIGENRKLATEMIEYANNHIDDTSKFIYKISSLVGFYANKNHTSFRRFNEDNINFYFVPVINACNRVLGDVTNLVYDILCLLYDENEYAEYSDENYVAINKKRIYMKSALINQHKKNNFTNAVVECLTPEMWDDNYTGIVGLVASDIVDEENKPALIGIAPMGNDIDNAIVKMSGRSVDGFNLFEALDKIKNEHPELNLKFGGHAEALGASCLYKDVNTLQEYLSDIYDPNKYQKNVIIYNIDETNIMNVLLLYKNFCPFGNKFKFPKFYISGNVRAINKENNLFFLDGIHCGIKYYNKDIKDKLFDYLMHRISGELEAIVSVIEDESGTLLLKLDKIL